MMRAFLAMATVALGLCAGCTSDDTMRLDGMTYGAGNAQAANTVMQMVDPWQYGVQHTDLEVPADRTRPAAAAAAPARASAARGTTTAND